MSWPEEMSFIANSSKIDRRKGKYLPAINQACSGGGGGRGGVEVTFSNTGAVG